MIGDVLMKPKHLELLIDIGIIKTNEGKTVKLYELQSNIDEDILNEWASHFRGHYCSDDEIEIQIAGTGLSKAEYLKSIKFPDESVSPGPSTRAGDFAEILIADYIEYLLNYYVPRTRYDRKINRNSSPMGSDVIGFKTGEIGYLSDELIIFEVKAQASESSPKNRLQDAIYDSKKDIVRIAESLNAIKQRLIDKNQIDKALVVQRFQNNTDRPYKRLFGAAAVHSKTSYSEALIKDATTLSHPMPDLSLIVIQSEKLMSLVHELYRRGAAC